MSPRILALLEQHPWPGNLRELVTVMQVALALAGPDAIGEEHLPAAFLAEAATPLPTPERSDTGQDLNALLHEANGNLSSVARALGISRTTLYKRLRSTAAG